MEASLWWCFVPTVCVFFLWGRAAVTEMPLGLPAGSNVFEEACGFRVAEPPGQRLPCMPTSKIHGQAWPSLEVKVANLSWVGCQARSRIRNVRSSKMSSDHPCRGSEAVAMGPRAEVLSDCGSGLQRRAIALIRGKYSKLIYLSQTGCTPPHHGDFIWFPGPKPNSFPDPWSALATPLIFFRFSSATRQAKTCSHQPWPLICH